MERLGYVSFTLRPGEALANVPAHLDYLSGAARAASRLDGGPIDGALRHRGDGFRAVTVFHARRSLGVPAEHHVGYDDVEEHLGMSRSYRARLGDERATTRVVDRLRSLPVVESATVQSLATVPFAAGVAGAGAPALDRPPPDVATAAAAEAGPDAARAPHEMVRAPQALALEPGDERVTVACVDSGVSLGHAELQRKLLAGYDTVDLGVGPAGRRMRLLGDSRGRDFSPLDDVGHGSAVAGIMGAQGWQLPRGAAGLSLILPIRVLAAARAPKARLPVGVGALPDIDAGLKVAVDLGAMAANLSFGTPGESLPEGAPLPHGQVAQYATHYDCVLVAAAGNTGRREKLYPAALPEVIAVGSVDLRGRRSSFSTWGDHVDIAAPGERIVSAHRRGYRASSGTSFAAPFVTAAAALAIARGRRAGRRLRPPEVREALLGSARALGGAPNDETGRGLLDAAGAVRHVDAARAAA
ncbi:MAG TPA: S8 family serine peptidase [Thermoleophilaceae bacterium]|nr:S8 family serine peptidase [Thermoleophilaceae bacterium]